MLPFATMAAPPDKKLRWGRLVLALVVVVGLCAGAYLIATR